MAEDKKPTPSKGPPKAAKVEEKTVPTQRGGKALFTSNRNVVQAIAVTRQDAVKLAQGQGQRELMDLLKRAQLDLSKRLKEAHGLAGPGEDSFTAHQLQVTLRQVTEVTALLNRGVKNVILSQGAKAADVAAGNMLDYMQRANKVFKGVAEAPLPLREASMLSKAQAGTRASILRRLSSDGEPEASVKDADLGPHPARVGILERYGMATVGHFEQTLQAGLITRKPWSDIRTDLIADSPFLQGAPAHWAERIVRTETMGALNRASWEATRAADDELEDMVKILAATFDDRTGWDSYQVHGQIRRPDEAFESAFGMYQAPPNRPNDREVVIPHRVSWPLPAELSWRSDGEVNAVYRKQRKKGSPGPRPLMTTVPLKLFGQDTAARKKDKSEGGQPA